MKIYTVAIGNYDHAVLGSEAERNAAKRDIAIIRALPGMVGIHPMYPHGNLVLFDSLGHARAARKSMEQHGIRTGHNIGRGELDDDFRTVMIEGTEEDDHACENDM